MDVLFAGQRVKGSPFYIEVFDVTKIRVDNFYNGNVGEQAGFTGVFWRSYILGEFLLV